MIDTPAATALIGGQPWEDLVTTLVWHGPYTIRGLLEDPRLYAEWQRPGVYAWTERVPGPAPSHGRIDFGPVKYIGRARSLSDRTLEHYLEYIACHYTVRLRKHEEWERTLDADGRRRLLDARLLARVMRASLRYAHGIQLFLAPVSRPVRIEPSLIYQLKPRDNLRGWRTHPARVTAITHRGPRSFVRGVRAQVRRSGLP